MPIPREALRLRPDDRNQLLAEARTLHCATVDERGVPHVVPLWFVWDGEAIWVNSLRRSRRGRDLERGSPASVCVDAGGEYGELRGLSAEGTFEPIDAPGLLEPIRTVFQEKYWHGAAVPDLRSHRWFRFVPTDEASWDFRRIAESGRDRRLEALQEHDPGVS